MFVAALLISLAAAASFTDAMVIIGTYIFWAQV